MPQNLPWTEAYFNASIGSRNVSTLKPYEVAQIVAMLKGKVSVRQADSLAGANEPTLATIFGDGINP